VAHGGVNGNSIFGTSIWADGATIAAEAAIGGAGSVAEGGDFLSGAIGSLGGALGELSGGGFMVRTAIAAAAGGTAAEIGGGSFENGAISAAYTYMFNHAAEKGAEIWITRSAKTETGYGLIDGIQDGLSVLGLVPFAGDVVDGINALIYLARGQHAEAAMSAAAMIPFGGIVSSGLRLSKRVGKLFKTSKAGAPKIGKIADDVLDWIGPGSKLEKPPGGSDLILRSSDGTRQIRFDLTNPHGLQPHINVETFRPRDLFPGDKKMIQTLNDHVFPNP
jgi:hypothetical protein